MFTRSLCVASVVSLFSLANTGCSTADYRGATPSVRSFVEVPRQPRDVYVGMDWRFSLDRPSEYHTFASSAPAAAQFQTAVSTTAGD